ncbi:PREDICTED: alpha-N-acetyl-neuraminyl-2,3-beta-galactosyl-1,3-N-acetyl-galactosaminide alpha-2,6-sialyltransferase [Gavialis gangeticus]|uniref:alpha-N-acetyl-neuraminyl-2,3-beta-galactosyl-1, 3-N-acetyl-galactosaminide alpha-2,6-sialyltransferase n=1 Tax=Gavialis gangeticus TaxID=94835 RepID=UPI00092E7C25|nr:PREDICTED: alpha-N-acetyl-neuraminyl-2,3-beta-galactosyl-1,3-N-acetyl-galactosaminide alpha-2,6-sialyltransferase [Gavialis gangeticus]
MTVLVRTFVTLLIVATGTILCVLLCPRFCLQHCWLSFKPGEKQESSRLTTSSTRSFQGYSRVPDGKPLVRAPCLRCAIVSSSGQMLGSRLGKEIDRRECVLRMNQAPTTGYEEDVGTRSTIRVVSHTSIPLLVRNHSYFFEQSLETLYIIWGPAKVMGREKVGRTYRSLLKVKQMYPSLEIYTLTEKMMAYCDEVFQNETGKNRMKSGTYLSTGWFTMVLAMELCEQIHIFGMISDGYCREKNHPTVQYHYFEKGKLDECRMYLVHERAPRGAHRFITEKVVFSRWAKRRNMVFIHPSWVGG